MRIENTVLNCFTDIQAPKKKPENPDEGVLRHFLEDTVGILIYGSLAADFPDIGITGIRKLLKKLRSRSTDRGGSRDHGATDYNAFGVRKRTFSAVSEYRG